MVGLDVFDDVGVDFGLDGVVYYFWIVFVGEYYDWVWLVVVD